MMVDLVKELYVIFLEVNDSHSMSEFFQMVKLIVSLQRSSKTNHI